MIDYNQYLKEFAQQDTFGSRRDRKNKKPKPMNEKRFNRLRDSVDTTIKANNYKSKEEAIEDIEIKIQKMDPISFLLFRAVITWIITRLLDSYFK
jgi:patatin-like phospholipase/acyl hydrolase